MNRSFNDKQTLKKSYLPLRAVARGSKIKSLLSSLELLQTDTNSSLIMLRPRFEAR